MLRTTIDLAGNGTPVQVVQAVTPVPTPVVDLTHLAPARHNDEVTRLARRDMTRPFDPADPQRLRVTLLRLETEVHVALFAADHAASDAWSLAIIVEELAAMFRSRLGDGPADLPSLDIQFGDFAAWQREERDEEREELEVQHWHKQLEGMPAESALPADRPVPARPTYAGGVYDTHLPQELAAGVQRFGEQEGASLFGVLLAACSVLLNRYSGEDDVVVGSLVSGRTRGESQRLIGSFANPLPLRVRMHDGLTLRQAVREAHATLASALDHQDLPFERVAEGLGLGRESTRTSFSRVWINVLTVPDMTLDLPGLRITPVSIAPAKTSVDLTLNVTPNAGTLQIQWHYMSELFDSATVALLAEQFQRVLHQLVTAPDTPVWAVELRAGAAGSEPTFSYDVSGFIEQFQRRVRLAPTLRRSSGTESRPVTPSSTAVRTGSPTGCGPQESGGTRASASWSTAHRPWPWRSWPCSRRTGRMCPSTRPTRRNAWRSSSPTRTFGCWSQRSHWRTGQGRAHGPPSSWTVTTYRTATRPTSTCRIRHRRRTSSTPRDRPAGPRAP